MVRFPLSLSMVSTFDNGDGTWTEDAFLSVDAPFLKRLLLSEHDVPYRLVTASGQASYGLLGAELLAHFREFGHECFE
ncbi:MAG: hypothetical protein WD273_09390 [Trueperaceae bacterium]